MTNNTQIIHIFHEPSSLSIHNNEEENNSGWEVTHEK